MNISKHITYNEAVKSTYAIRHNIDNIPDTKQLTNMILLAEKIYEPLRNMFNKPIRILSFFRSEELNEKIGGAKNSQHTAKNGAAIDIEAYEDSGLTNADIFYTIKYKFIFDQLIWEFGNENQPDWIHVSYNELDNRKQVLKAIKENGKTKYIKYDN